MTAYALLGIKHRSVLNDGNGLVTAIHAGYVASLTAYALIAQKLRINDIGAVKTVRRNDLIRRDLLHVGDVGDVILLQTQGNPILNVINDPVTVQHYRRCYLYGISTQNDEFQSISPGLNAAHGTDVLVLQISVLCQFGYES